MSDATPDDHPGLAVTTRAADAPLSPEEEREWLTRHKARTPEPGDRYERIQAGDPRDPRFARPSIGETPGTVLHFWFGQSTQHASGLTDRQGLWFAGAFDTDEQIARRFGGLLARLASGEALRWAAAGPRERLAAILVLDQFSRSIFRGTPGAFENDPLARQLTREAIWVDDEATLHPVERWFLYMPLEHSENLADQKLSVSKFTELARTAPDSYRPAMENALDYARRHEEVIRRFGRFPHRNGILGRTTTQQETAWLNKHGGF
jgi:uncharacterized protein (DUF924 family)